MALAAQDHDDFYDERGWWLRLWMANLILGLGWGSHAFEFNTSLLCARYNHILTDGVSRQCVSQTSVFECEMRAIFVVSCYICLNRQLDSSVLIL